MDFKAHLTRQIAFSRATFGPGRRTEGVIEHIGDELREVVTSNGDPAEWVDVAILALDGLWRSIEASFPHPLSGDHIAERAVAMIVEKQARNELRTWPDWRTSDPTKPIQHVRV